MALAKISQVSGTALYVPGSDIDTDRIIPARFMKCVTFDGLGEYLFYDVRKNEDGTNKNHPLNEARFEGASILLSGINFGCGSSREHAPQAIYRYGFRAVIAESFAEIFYGNCSTLGIPAVTASREDIATLAEAINADPKVEVTIDVENKVVRYGDTTFPVALTDASHEALVAGQWDPIAELLESEAEVASTAAEVAYLVGRP